jgi:hypothetical protein
MKSTIRYRAAGLLLFIAMAPRFHAQTAADNASAKPLGYDAAEEITVSGAATAFLNRASKGMLSGSHLFISTSSGALDVSVGSYGVGKETVEINTGTNVEVTGVMKTLNGRPVLLARVLREGNQVYTIRTKQGIVLSPLARKHAASKAAQDGGAL